MHSRQGLNDGYALTSASIELKDVDGQEMLGSSTVRYRAKPWEERYFTPVPGFYLFHGRPENCFADPVIMITHPE